MPQAAVPSARGTAPISRLAVVIVLAASQVLVFGSVPVRGADTIPDEPGAIRIDGPSFAALVADVDGDGTAELVRITTTGGDGTGLGVEIWRQAADGSWDITAPAVPLLRGETPAAVGSIGPRDLTPATVGDAVRLLLWHHAGKARVLAVVNAANAGTNADQCCLTVWDVTQPAGGDPPLLRLLIDTHGGGGTIFAVDMDGDGTDELAIYDEGGQNTPGGQTTPASFRVLRWIGGQFRLTSRLTNAGESPLAYPMGNSDGLPGDEIGFIGSFGQGPAGWGLTRVSLRGSAIHDETTELPFDGVVLRALPGEAGGSPCILYGGPDEAMLLFTWPADGDVVEVAHSSIPGAPVGVVGSGRYARVLARSAPLGSLALIGLDLSASTVQAVTPSRAAAPYVKRSYAPYVGPWPDGVPGHRDALIADGWLLAADAGTRVMPSPMAALPGMAPLGQLGHKSEWTALEQRTTSAPKPLQVARDGGLLQTADAGITLVRTADVLSPEAGGGAVRPSIEDGVIDQQTPTSPTLIIGTPVFEATVTAPPGSISMTVTGTSDQFHVLVQSPAQDPSAEIGGPPFRIPIVSSIGTPGNQAFDATLHVITPAGHGYTATWHVRLLRTPPKITAESSFVSLGFGTTLQGKTDPSATVTADGRSTHAGPDGRYQLNVPASLIPREVHIQARDPVGNVASIMVTVIAPVDYRRLPWLPIVAVLTVAAGVVLFLRAPRVARRRAASAPADDAIFEEIDGD
jgi:hypothetical protein